MLYLDKSILEDKPRNDELWDTVGSHPAQPSHVLLLGTIEGGTYQKNSHLLVALTSYGSMILLGAHWKKTRRKVL